MEHVCIWNSNICQQDNIDVFGYWFCKIYSHYFAWAWMWTDPFIYVFPTQEQFMAFAKDLFDGVQAKMVTSIDEYERLEVGVVLCVLTSWM